MEIFIQGYQRCTVLDLTQYYPNVKLTEKTLYMYAFS